MGAFNLGFQQGGDVAAAQAQHHRGIEDEQRQQNLQRNWGILNDPSSSEDLKSQAGQAITNLYPTPAHKGTFLSDVLHIRSKNQAQQQPASPAPSQSSMPAQDPPPPSGASDSLGVPYAGLAAPSTPGAPTASPSTPAATPPPSSPATPISAAATAKSPQEAMNLWRSYRGPAAINEDIATQHANLAANAAQRLAEINNAAREREAVIRTQGNAAMQKLDAAAQSLGAESFSTATPEQKMQAMTAMKTANTVPTWKSVTDGNSVYAVDAHDPNKRQLIGHKDDLTSHLEYKTLTNADGSQYEVPFVTWTKKGSSQPIIQTQDSGAATPEGSVPTPPVSSATPAGPLANPGARQPGTKPDGGPKKNTQAARSTPTPTSSSTPPPPGLPKGAIPFGRKPSILDKADATVYGAAMKEAAQDTRTADFYQQAYQQPGNKSAYDTSLITDYTGILAKGGRKTQAEIDFAKKIGGFGMRMEALGQKARTGELPPQMRQLYVDYLRARAQEESASTQSLRNNIQQNLNGTQAPVSSNTPPGPGVWKVDPAWPPAPKIDGKVLKADGQIVAKSQGGDWVQP